MDIPQAARKAPIAHGAEILKVAGTRTLAPAALVPGDLIFKYSGDQLLHVSIVTFTHASGAADHAHQLNDAALIGLHETTVTTASNLVVRCRHEPLRKAAAELAHRWTDLAMPYSNHRRRVATVHAEKWNDRLVKTHRKLFDEVGKFRAIKFAARRKGDLIYPSEKDARIEGNRGMFCSMFVAVCYQVAGLQGLVSEAPDGIRVSDKSTTKADLKEYRKTRRKLGATAQDFRQFEQYLGHLQDVDPYVLRKIGTTDADRLVATVKAAPEKRIPFGAAYEPSLAFWKSERCSVATCDWPQYITKGMMLDAKVIMPLGLLQCLLDDVGEGGGWEVMGVLGAVDSFLRTKTEEGKRRADQQVKTNQRFPFPSKK